MTPYVSFLICDHPDRVEFYVTGRMVGTWVKERCTLELARIPTSDGKGREITCADIGAPFHPQQDLRGVMQDQAEKWRRMFGGTLPKEPPPSMGGAISCAAREGCGSPFQMP